MEYAELDEKLIRFDYSLCHHVREDLKNRLLSMRLNEKKTSSWSRRWGFAELDAAGIGDFGKNRKWAEE